MSDTVKQSIREAIISAGACAVGFAEAAPVDNAVTDTYYKWLECGSHADMSYLDRYHDVRRDPRLLLEGAQTVISCAFDYRQPVHHSLFADYALGRDYHEVIRERLSDAAALISERFGGDTRICVDTAPIHERYWAARAGIGFRGLNGLIIVDGIGSKVFLAEILWTGSVTPDPSRVDECCRQCGACIKACPGKALTGTGTLDARHCNSYLTIEHRGDLPEDLKLPGRIYGCDVCQDVCPYNNTSAHSSIPEFMPSEALMRLDIRSLRTMTDDGYRNMFRHSAVRRAKLAALLRNASRH